MYNYNHQRHGGVPRDLGIRSHQLTLGTRLGIHISRLVPWIHVVAAEGGQGNNAQSGAVSSCLHGGKAEWPNWTNNDRFCRPSLGRSLAWYTTTGSNGCQSLESFWCFLIWCFAHCILDAVYTNIPFLSFTTDRYSTLDVSKGVSGKATLSQQAFIYKYRARFQLSLLGEADVCWLHALGQCTETWKGISTKDLSSFAARALKDANQQLDLKCWLHLRVWYCFGSYSLLGILTNWELSS